jgi:hypothetical protein
VFFRLPHHPSYQSRKEQSNMSTQRRTSRLRPAIVPLTPEPRPTPGEMNHAELIETIFNLRTLLSAERRRHATMETALSRYQSLLEKTITDQREAFKTLGKELLPHEMDKR